MVKHLVGKLLEEAERPLLNSISMQLEGTRNMLVEVAEGDTIPCTNYVQTWGWKHCLVYKTSSTNDGDILGLSYLDVIHKFSSWCDEGIKENCHHQCTVFFWSNTL